MLAKKQLRKNRQQDCKLLAMPVEITIYIIKSSGLDAFDTASLMLTCKEFASLINNFNVEPKLKTQLQSSKEVDILDRYEWGEGPDFSDEEEAEDYNAFIHAEQEELKARTDLKGMQGFLQRLDAGWNQSKSRLCANCNFFRPTTQTYWDKQVPKYLYKSDGRVARGYRIMQDCRCDCTPEKVISRWIKYQTEAFNRFVQCPDCIFGDTLAYAPTCARCSEMSLDLDWAFECGCSRCYCPGCHDLYS